MGVAGEPAVLGNLALSPDQKKAAFQRSDRGNQDIWVTDLERGGASRLTFDPALDVVPVWSPDGATIAYGAMRDGVLQIFAKSAAGTGREELLLKHPEGTAVPLDWSPDGRQILGAVVTPKNKWFLWVSLTMGFPRCPPLSPPEPMGRLPFTGICQVFLPSSQPLASPPPPKPVHPRVTMKARGKGYSKHD